MKKGLHISLRPGERIYVNGAVIKVDRKDSVEFLNDVTFLLEHHVLQPEDTRTPLRQLYFIVQTVLIDPANSADARGMFGNSFASLLESLENQKIRPAQVIGPLGEPLTLDSLPPATTTRWVVRRKAEVVAAVAGGLLTVDEACQRYSLSLEEFTSWQRAVDRSGMPGLRVTRIKQYRDQYERQARY